jgi:heparanase
MVFGVVNRGRRPGKEVAMRRIALIIIVLMFALLVTFVQLNKNKRYHNKDGTAPISIAPAKMPRIGTVSDRYQSYNIEMLEVTGGKFWKPYAPKLDSPTKGKAPTVVSSGTGGDTPAGMNPDLYAYRPPLDLTNARLRKLAAALGPVYVRVSGTWANTTYFPGSDETPKTPPAGFMRVLDRKSVV